MLKNSTISYFQLFLIFIKIGAILLGGGYVILPIIINEFETKRKLISEEDIINFYALSQSLPGIVAANMSMFIGYKLKGKFGAILAMIGIIFVPFWLIVLFVSLLEKFVNNTYVQGALYGIGIAVVALIMLTVREMWQKSNRDKFFYLIFFLSLFVLVFIKLSPIQVILLFSVIGILMKKFRRAEK